MTNRRFGDFRGNSTCPTAEYRQLVRSIVLCVSGGENVIDGFLITFSVDLVGLLVQAPDDGLESCKQVDLGTGGVAYQELHSAATIPRGLFEQIGGETEFNEGSLGCFRCSTMSDD